MTKNLLKLVSSGKLVLLTAMLLFTAVSCNKQLDLQSTRQANETGHWTTYEDARSGLVGMYGLFRAALAD